MSLLNTIKKGVSTLGKTAKDTAIGVGQGLVTPTLDLGRTIQSGLSKGIDKATGTQGFGLSTPNAAIEKALTPQNTTQKIGNVTAQLAPLAMGGVSAIKSGASLLKGAAPKTTTFAERLANTASAADRSGLTTPRSSYTIKAPASAPKGQPSTGGPLKSGTSLPGDVRGGASDIVRSSSKLETKTTNARNSGTIDTRIAPKSSGTVRNKPVAPEPPASAPASRPFPWAKTGLGLGAAGLVGSSFMGGGEAQPNQTPAPQSMLDTAANTAQGVGDQFAPSNVFASNTTGGGTPSAGVGGFGDASTVGTPLGGIGSGGFSGAPVSPFMSASMGNPGEREKDPRDELLEKILGLSDPSRAERKSRDQEEDLARRIAELTGNQELENLEIEGEPIAADARQGRRNMIDLQTRRSLVPLQTSLSLIQTLRERDEADRIADQDALKYQYEQLYPKSSEGNGFTLSEGQTRYDNEGNLLASGPQAQGEGNELLSPTEAMALGVPYGTTRAQAFGRTPEKPPTQSQYTANLYATRMGEADQILSSLGNSAIGMNPALFAAYGAIEPNAIGNAAVPAEFRQLRQAERNFLTAVLRRESGATIQPSEFAEGARIYFPRPGDDSQTIAQKAQARKTAIDALVQESRGSFQGFGSVPVTSGGGGEWNW